MNDILNQLIRAVLSDSPFSCDNLHSDSLDWNEIFREMKDQTIYALPFIWLEEHPLQDDELMERWTKLSMASFAQYFNLVEVQKKLGTLLEEAEIPYVILKGTSAGMYYPNPELRCYGDIDVLVKPDDFSQALALLEENGFIMEEDDKRHAELMYDSVSVELHRRVSVDIRDKQKEQEALDRCLIRAIDRAVYRQSADGFYSLPDAENGLVLLHHIKQHMLTGLGLRQIIDWMMYVRNVLYDEFWNNDFEQLAEAAGLRELAVTATRMCQMYLGLTEEIIWCQAADAELCEELMKLVCSSGNFGRKADSSTIKTMDVLTGGNIFVRLQKRGMYNWQEAKRYPILRPFAWLYQIGRYVFYGFGRNNPLASLIRDMRESRKRMRLFKKLGCGGRI